jgi:hypothetical protein
MKKSVFGLLSFLLAASGVSLAQSQQEPSLGDLAKQHRDGKKTIKTFTNEDVATSSPSVPVDSPRNAPVSASSNGSSPAPSANDAKADKDKKESAGKAAAATKDSPEVAELKQKLSSYQQQLDGWKNSAKKYQDLLAGETSDFRRQMYQDALQGDQQNVQLYQSKVDQAQADLAKAQKASSSNH